LFDITGRDYRAHFYGDTIPIAGKTNYMWNAAFSMGCRYQYRFELCNGNLDSNPHF